MLLFSMQFCCSSYLQVFCFLAEDDQLLVSDERFRPQASEPGQRKFQEFLENFHSIIINVYFQEVSANLFYMYPWLPDNQELG